MVTNPFSELSVNVSANTRSFRRGMDRAVESLQDLSTTAGRSMAVMTALQGRFDEVSDELNEVGRAANGASRSMATLSASAAGSAGSMLSLSAATSALGFSLESITSAPLLALIPAVAALGTVLFPLAATVGTLTAGVTALAGAFGAVVGSGILAFGQERAEQNKEELAVVQERIQMMETLRERQGELTEEQQQRLSSLREQANQLEEQTSALGGLQSAMADLRDELTPIIVQFGNEFVPLIEDAIDAIPQLVRDIIGAVDGLDRFRETLRMLGRSALDVIPRIVGRMMDLARRALPIFLDVVGRIGRLAPRVFESMLRVTEALAPAFSRFINTFVRATPEFTALGTAILNVAIPAISRFLSFAEDIIQLGQQSDGFVDFIRTGVQRLIQWIQGPGQALISTAVNQLLSTITALLGGGESDNVLTALINVVGDALTGLSDWFNASGQERITNLLTSLFGALADSLTAGREQFRDRIFSPIASIIASLFRSLTTALSSEEGGAFATAAGNLGREIVKTIVDSAIDYVASEAFTEDLGRLGGALANSLGRAAFNLGRSEDVSIGSALRDPVGTGLTAIQQQRQLGTEPFVQPTQETARPQQIEIVVEEDTDLTNTRIRNTSEDVLINQIRRGDRQRDRGFQP